MISRDNFSEEHIRYLQKEHHRDPILVERTLYAFGLLEALVKVGLQFTFKGGTSLMLLLSKPMRLSTDIDIVVEPGTDIDAYIEKAKTIFPFKDGGEQERDKKGNIEKRHFKFIYDSPVNSGDDLYIFLDVLFEENHYEHVTQKEIKNDLLLTEGENLIVIVPTIDCALGDKLTAFAPHTTGIRFGKKNLEIMKQFFDISTLIAEHTDFDCIRKTYKAICTTEISYRGITCTTDDALLDTISSAICIGSRGKYQEDDFPNYLEGSRRVTNHIFKTGFSMEIASRMSPMIIYMATSLLLGEPFEAIDDPSVYTQESLSQPDLLLMKGLRKIDQTAYGYIVKADRLLSEYRKRSQN